LVWLPYYHLDFEPPDGTPLPGVESLIDALGGAFAQITLANQSVQDGGAGPTFEPSLNLETAERLGREGWLRRRLLWRSPGAAALGALQRWELIRYPFWVYYYERRRGRLDVKLLDAVNGSRPGAAVKVAFLRALVGSEG